MSDSPQADAAAAAVLKSVMEKALADRDIQRIYANGFSLGITNADAYVLLQSFGRPIAIVNLSYTLAKTLAEKLTTLVTDWEAKTGQKLATTDTIEQAFGKEAK